MSEQISIKFLTPTSKDNFKEEKLGDDSYKVTFGDSHIVVKIIKEDSMNFQISELVHSDEYHHAKLFGYVLFKIKTRYE